MNGQELFQKDGASAKAWFCTECNRISASQQAADQCCTCYVCGKIVKLDSIGKPNFTGLHKSCSDSRRAEQNAARISKAEKLEEWDGWVFNDGPAGGPDEDYASSVDEMAEYLEDKLADGEISLEDWPEYVHVCKAKNVCLDAQDILQNLCEELGYEDCYDDLNGIDEFEKAVAKFNAANADVHSYEPDYKRVVRIPRPGVGGGGAVLGA